MRPDLNGLIRNIIETIGSLIPFIIVIGTFAGKISKAKKKSEKEKKISREIAMEKYSKMEKKKKSDIKKSFLQEINRVFNEEENRKTVRETLYSAEEETTTVRENLQKDGIDEVQKDEDYRFSKNTDDMIREIQKEREELREKDLVFTEEYDEDSYFEVDIDSELENYDLANAFILKEILDKPVSLRD